MLGASSVSASKRYGRGNSSVVDGVFSKQPTADPFLFDSDEDDGKESATKVKSKAAQPAKKKSKVRLL